MKGFFKLATFALLIPSIVWAQEDTATPPRGPATIVATFSDGTVIRKATLVDSLEITTQYGKLVVPPASIRRIEFRTFVSAELDKKIRALIEQLGHQVFARREAASKELVAIGPLAFPSLQKAAESGDMEVARRAQVAVEQLRQNLTDDQLRIRPNDVIHTQDCVLTGQISATVLKAQTDNFGDMEFKLGNLSSIHLAESRKDVTLDANAAGVWFETGITVDAGAGLIVSALGQVVLNPQALGNEGASSPDGNSNLGRTPEGFYYGTLLGRIGPAGPVFPIGQRYEGKVPADGKLYLQFATPTGGSRPTGAYQVKVVTGIDVAVKEQRPVPRSFGPGGSSRSSRGGFSGPGGFQRERAPGGREAPPNEP